jgi:hypothetical protein
MAVESSPAVLATMKRRSQTMEKQTRRVNTGRLAVAMVGLVAGPLVFFGAAPRAQLVAPGPSGVVMGHLHLGTKDVEASRRFWAALGGVAVQNSALQLIQLPGTFVMLRQSQQITGGSEGSTVERVVLRVRTSEMPQLVQRLERATGSKSEKTAWSSSFWIPASPLRVHG